MRFPYMRWNSCLSTELVFMYSSCPFRSLLKFMSVAISFKAFSYFVEDIDWLSAV